MARLYPNGATYWDMVRENYPTLVTRGQHPSLRHYCPPARRHGDRECNRRIAQGLVPWPAIVHDVYPTRRYL